MLLKICSQLQTSRLIFRQNCRSHFLPTYQLLLPLQLNLTKVQLNLSLLNKLMPNQQNNSQHKIFIIRIGHIMATIQHLKHKHTIPFKHKINLILTISSSNISNKISIIHRIWVIQFLGPNNNNNNNFRIQIKINPNTTNNNINNQYITKPSKIFL
jgi:hypothetical protein